jgi:hypothetical protein
MESIIETRDSINGVRLFSLFAALLLSSILHAQKGCDVEAKLLLSPTDEQAAVTALNLKSEATGFVYFFDTNNLDLLSQGVIVRLRQGIGNDLTVKLRPSKGEKFSDSATEQETFKCEIDFIGDRAIPAYSISRRYTGETVPQTGSDISRLFSAGQKRLFEERKASIDWSRVERMVEIRATVWKSKTWPQFNKLTLELWEWPDGRILEVSTKSGSHAGPRTYAQLQELVNSKLLPLSHDQRSKTSTVLESISHHPTR